MPIDIQQLATGIAAAVGLLTIFGTLGKWLGKLITWAFARRNNTNAAGEQIIPRKTMALVPVSRPNAFWWHAASIEDSPAMQIVGDLHVTNISNCPIFVVGSKLKKPASIGNVFVKAQGENVRVANNTIPPGVVSTLRFDFLIQPVQCDAGKDFVGDIAIVDQFGNEH